LRKQSKQAAAQQAKRHSFRAAADEQQHTDRRAGERASERVGLLVGCLFVCLLVCILFHAFRISCLLTLPFAQQGAPAGGNVG
jgi:uncharacterized membrane protein